MLTLKEAAEKIGRTKPTVLKAIKTGRLSANKNEQGEWRIDPAELHRVYPDAVNETAKLNDTKRPVNDEESAVIALLREQLEDRAGVIEDLRADRDHWRQQAKALLPHQDEPPPKAKRFRWWFNDRL